MKVGIVGAGIMGQLLAFYLVRAGMKVSLFANNSNNCSMAAAGLLAPMSELENASHLIYELGSAAIEYHWPIILSELNANIYYVQSGSLVVAHPQDKADLLQFIEKIQTHYPAEQNIKKINTIALEPELTKFDEAYYFPKEAQLDNQTLLIELKKYLLAHDVAWYDKGVDSMTPGKIRMHAMTHIFDQVFDCRGMGGKAFFPDLQAIRGELIWLYAPDVNIQRPLRFLHPRYRLYIVPRPNHIYLVGASEIHAENYDEISVRSTLELLTATYYIHPGFAEARILKTVTQCRPTFPNYLPRIFYSDGLVAANGLYRHGFLLAPTLCDEIMRWLQHGTSSLRYPQIGEFHDSYSIQ